MHWRSQSLAHTVVKWDELQFSIGNEQTIPTTTSTPTTTQLPRTPTQLMVVQSKAKKIVSYSKKLEDEQQK